MMNWTTTQIKQLVEKYPYLAPHNSWTGKVVEEYDYSYTELCSLPEGWHKLFLLLCKELRPHIEKAGLLNTWYFTQLKEKYGTMRVYTCNTPKTIDHLIDLYECYSKYVCLCCFISDYNHSNIYFGQVQPFLNTFFHLFVFLSKF